MMKLCADKQCERFGIALNDWDFPKNKRYLKVGLRDGLGIYCKDCANRRVQEYRDRIAEIPLRAKVKIPPSQRVHV